MIHLSAAVVNNRMLNNRMLELHETSRMYQTILWLSEYIYKSDNIFDVQTVVVGAKTGFIRRRRGLGLS